MNRAALTLVFFVLASFGFANDRGTTVVVGSKKFTESVILAEIAAQVIRDAGFEAVHERELGGTRILWSALLRGDIDVYPEYTGTLAEEIFAGENIRDGASLQNALKQNAVEMAGFLGFENTYALGLPQALAEKRRIHTITDLARHDDLVLGFSNEFMDRADGWPSLRNRYRLPHQKVRGLDHDLAYRGLENGDIHVTDLYSTDAEIRYYKLRVLEDDLHYFPAYQAVLLFRDDLHAKAPAAVDALRQLEGTIDERKMIELNARAKLDRVPENRVAADFLAQHLQIRTWIEVESAAARIARHTAEHLALVSVSLAAAIILAVPLGILAQRRPRLGHGILGAIGILQTIPSLALLVFMIPLLGIGGPPAVAALFVYSLLPIVRNTHAGLRDISPSLRESAEALGLPSWARLRLIELPLASPMILAGIKTAAIINVGTATLGAIIGAGGLGQPILTGIRLDDVSLILQGAVPAAGLALLVQGFFDLLERGIVPRGLRIRRSAALSAD